jgi:hypothetical protein
MPDVDPAVARAGKASCAGVTGRTHELEPRPDACRDEVGASDGPSTPSPATGDGPPTAKCGGRPLAASAAMDAMRCMRRHARYAARPTPAGASKARRGSRHNALPHERAASRAIVRQAPACRSSANIRSISSSQVAMSRLRQTARPRAAHAASKRTLRSCARRRVGVTQVTSARSSSTSKIINYIKYIVRRVSSP